MTMHNRLDDAKAELLARAAAVVDRQQSTLTDRTDSRAPLDLEPFLGRYYRHVAPEDLVDRDPVDVVGAALSHRAFAQRRPQGTANVRVFTPSIEEHGWTSGHTVVEIVTDDMPFLVDSVTMALSAEDRPIHLVVHPQLVVRRDVTGALLEVREVADSGPSATAEPDAIVESWMHIEIDRDTDPEQLRAAEVRLGSVLRDVQEAVEDWEKMGARARAISDELDTATLPVPDDERDEAVELLRWLADDHFTFLGYREYVLDTIDGEDALRAVTGTGLGILRTDQGLSGSFGKLPPTVRAKAREKTLLVLTKANSRATVHRPTYLDYVGVKVFDDNGEVVGERRFLGLYTAAAYTESVMRIPVLRAKARAVLENSGFASSSHSGKDLLQILETYPRDELFHTPVDELLPTAKAVLYLQERRQLRLFVRRDPYGRYLSFLVYLPRDRFDTAARLRIQDILMAATGGASIDHAALVGESVLARLHFVIRFAPGARLPEVDEAQLERQLTTATRAWADDFADTLADQVGEEEAARLMRRYGRAFPEALKEDFPARIAVADARRLEDLPDDDGLGLNLYRPIGGRPDEMRLKIYRTGQPVSLTYVLPLLSRMGVEVVDERPYEVERAGAGPAYIYDFGLRHERTGRDVDTAGEGAIKERFQEALSATWFGRAESDGFNALVLSAGLSWRQVVVLRAYARYLRQTGTTFSQSYLQETLVGHRGIAKLLVELFEARFDPARFGDDHESRQAAVNEISKRIDAALDEVASLDQDRILRAFHGCVLATLRTNYFQRDAQGNEKSYLSFKFDSQLVPDLPKPRPKYEIWVYSPAVEGVHLRFGPVARGGLRWSDRREDFRTEVLGLVKAQAVKNAVIVPVGAKGGFIGKALPDASVDREAWLAAGIECYRTFIRGLLDLTDNRLPDGSKEPPPMVVRHDGDDPYLVVAADKGTATFSDIANALSIDYGFWLGDAFASGGSAGYDHKAMGITARGAWESVKRHFREMGRDCQTEDFTVVGIGDMSGDVFGNGMLLSEHIRLVAAFDHRHIFLDPNPVAASSFAERRRLFELPRSSWADYDQSLISEGGGVHPRSAKKIAITPQVRDALGIADDVEDMTPPELMRAILQAPVDLLWNGGIGTYVKASSETHASVGDKANDAIRIDGADLRAKAVGEGGNLGFTQLGRVEYALAGGRHINSDAIDNSAGVDTSDHEVNIKILLEGVVRAGDLTTKQRNELLTQMTDEVAELVLANNRGQNVAIASAVAQAPSLMHVHRSYVRAMEAAGELDRRIEFLPTEQQFADRQAGGAGLTAPELAVILAYTKNKLFDELVNTSLPDDPYLRDLLHAYFPSALSARFPDEIDAHPLRREIITTALVNEVVNNAGTTFVFRLAMETGSAAEDLFRAHTVARAAYHVDDLWREISQLDNVVPADTQTWMRLQGRTLIERATRWLAVNRRPPIDIAWQVEFFEASMGRLLTELPGLLTGRELALFESSRDRMLAAGVPKELAERVAVLSPAYAGLGMIETAVATGTDLYEVAQVYYALGERLGLDRLLDRIMQLPRADRWQTMARAAQRDELGTLHTQLAGQVLLGTEEGHDAAARVEAWIQAEPTLFGRAEETLRELVDGDAFDLARLSVALRVIRSLLRAPGAA